MRRVIAALLALSVLAVSACEGDAVRVDAADTAAIYADVAVRLCAEAGCGPSHAVFVLLKADTPLARSGVTVGLPNAAFIATTEGLIGPDDRVVEGGRILHIDPPRPQTGEPIVVVDTFWESSRFEGKGETYVYAWDDGTWVHVEPSTVGVTVTTAVP